MVMLVGTLDVEPSRHPVTTTTTRLSLAAAPRDTLVKLYGDVVLVGISLDST
jgi:hypothetical protein